jgi:hypothetical protein
MTHSNDATPAERPGHNTNHHMEDSMTRSEVAAKFPQYDFNSLFFDAPATDWQSIVITHDGFHKGCYTLHLSEDEYEDNVTPVTYAPGAIIENIPTWEEANELIPLVRSLAD